MDYLAHARVLAGKHVASEAIWLDEVNSQVDGIDAPSLPPLTLARRSLGMVSQSVECLRVTLCRRANLTCHHLGSEGSVLVQIGELLRQRLCLLAA